MGYIDVFSEKKTSPIDNKIFNFSVGISMWELSLPDEDEEAQFSVGATEILQNGIEGEHYHLFIPKKFYSDTYTDKWIEAFLHNVDFRKRFRTHTNNSTTLSLEEYTLPKLPGLTNIQKKTKETKLQKEIINLNTLKKPKFKDFLRLKSGRDIFSSKKIETLTQLVSIEDIKKVKAIFADDKQQAIVYRWILRGLKTDLAIRKLKTDIEVGENYNKQKRG